MSAEFFHVKPVSESLQTLFEHWQPSPEIETIDTFSAVSRITAQSIHSPLQIPPFRKSTVDGYAVIAKDTFGASQTLPTYLTLRGELHMGEVPTLDVATGETLLIHTGGMLPDSADAVVMVEYTHAIDNDEIEVLKAVAPGENIIQIGEDVGESDVILPQYHRIRPQDIGGLLAVGITEIEVLRQPRVGILSCGDELVDPHETPAMGQIRDINAYTLSALVENAGGIPIRIGISPDTLEAYTDYAQRGFEQSDIFVLTAGSSVSARDLTHTVINQLGDPGVLQHGLATKPGKPTILAVCDGNPVIGLPGNPVSALLVARQILPALIRRYLQQKSTPPQIIQAALATNIASVTGREDWIPVRLSHDEHGNTIATPIFGKSNLIFTLIQADGLMRIPINSGGVRAGTEIDVLLF